MICDDCIKKSVCKLYDSGDTEDCTEFSLPHQDILKLVWRKVAVIPCEGRNVLDVQRDTLNVIDSMIEKYEENKSENEHKEDTEEPTAPMLCLKCGRIIPIYKKFSECHLMTCDDCAKRIYGGIAKGVAEYNRRMKSKD